MANSPTTRPAASGACHSTGNNTKFVQLYVEILLLCINCTGGHTKYWCYCVWLNTDINLWGNKTCKLCHSLTVHLVISSIKKINWCLFSLFCVNYQNIKCDFWLPMFDRSLVWNGCALDLKTASSVLYSLHGAILFYLSSRTIFRLELSHMATVANFVVRNQNNRS